MNNPLLLFYMTTVTFYIILYIIQLNIREQLRGELKEHGLVGYSITLESKIINKLKHLSE